MELCLCQNEFTLALTIRSFAPFGALTLLYATQGLRPGLHSGAASRLMSYVTTVICVFLAGQSGNRGDSREGLIGRSRTVRVPERF
jgi:hypothetical protein